MRLLDHFQKGFVELSVDLASKEDIFMRVARFLEDKRVIAKGEDIFDKLLAREELMTTGIGNGFAIPHAFADGLDQTVAVFLSLKEPIEFESVDGKFVRYVFVLIGPKNKQVVHLKLLARISRLIGDEEFARELEQVQDKNALLELVDRYDQKIAV